MTSTPGPEDVAEALRRGQPPSEIAPEPDPDPDAPAAAPQPTATGPQEERTEGAEEDG